jgi:hypothetical protein
VLEKFGLKYTGLLVSVLQDIFWFFQINFRPRSLFFFQETERDTRKKEE